VSENKVNTDKTSIDEAIQGFARKRKNQRIGFALVLAGVMVAIIAIISYASHLAKKEQRRAVQAEHQATQATQTLDVVANDILARVQDIDQRAKQLCHCENPTAYLWRDGLHPRKGKPVGQIDSALIALLQERTSLLVSAGPVLGASEGLKAYVCNHIWFVTGESLEKSKAEEYLRTQRLRDPRFQVAELGAGPRNPSQAAVNLGFFLTRREVGELQKEIGVEPFEIRRWDPPYQPNCPATNAAD